MYQFQKQLLNIQDKTKDLVAKFEQEQNEIDEEREKERQGYDRKIRQLRKREGELECEIRYLKD